MSNHFKIARELFRQINQDKIQVLSSSLSIKKRDFDFVNNLQIKGKSKNTKRFMMNVMDAQFQSAIWRNRELLQQLIDTAMTCQQCVFDCSKINRHSQSCLRCELAGKTSTSCFVLAKNLFNGQSVSPQLLLQCAHACKNFAGHLDKSQLKHTERYQDSCLRLVDACLNLYKKVGAN
jgi:hypothetical protein